MDRSLSKVARLEDCKHLHNSFHIFLIYFFSLHYHFCDGSLLLDLLDKLNLFFLTG